MTGYIGIGGTAKKVKNIYVGVGGVAKKVKKGYIGVGGVARLWYALQKKLSYYGTLSNVATGGALGAARTGNYAVFAGGRMSLRVNRAGETTVKAVSSSLVVSTPTAALTSGRHCLRGAEAGDYAIFGGGGRFSNNSDSNITTTDAYGSTLVKATITNGFARRWYGSATVNGKAVFAGGDSTKSVGNAAADVWSYNDNLVYSKPSALPAARSGLMGTGFANHAIFAGGIATSGGTDIPAAANITAYDASLVQITTIANMSVGRFYGVAVANKKNILFAGGSTNRIRSVATVLNTVDAYDVSLVKITSPAVLSVARGSLSAESIGEYFVLCFGATDYVGSIPDEVFHTSSAIDSYDDALVHTTWTSSLTNRTQCAAKAIGDYVIFAGGNYYSSSTYYYVGGGAVFAAS